ncbi:MAG TPA: ATP-binding protein [Verrucomicrobiae bacterium]|nr:ATP-binding protein [Verrucomicrobiae bacterium]
MSLFIASIANAEPETVPAATLLTDAVQLRQLAAREEISGCSVRLEGTVLWVSSAGDQIVFQDSAGCIILKISGHGQALLQPGRHVLIEGSCEAGRGEAGSIALVDNDGNHMVFEGTGQTFLSAGLHPVRVEWFNNTGDFALEVDVEGPGLPRQPVPSDELFRAPPNHDDTTKLSHGVDYQCYEGQWESLPPFARLSAVKSGVATNFDIGVRTRDPGVGLVFTGYFSAPRAGLYRFWSKSDDGSRLFIEDVPLHITILGDAPVSAPGQFFSGQLSHEAQEGQWVEIEGAVSHVRGQSRSPWIELSSAAGPVYVRVMEDRALPWNLLSHSRIKCVGLYQSAHAVDGKMVASFVVPGADQISILEMDPAHWNEHPVENIAAILSTNEVENSGAIVHLSGTVATNSAENIFTLTDSSGKVEIESSQPKPSSGDQIEVLGWLDRANARAIIHSSFYRKIVPSVDAQGEGLPLLTTAVQVMRLSRKEAQRGYPVKIRGIITARVGGDFFIQDSTSSIYVSYVGPTASGFPRIGDYWEIEGISHADFAPDVQIHHASYLGPGILPEPVRPTWDELINGAVATKYVEIPGIVISPQTDNIVLLTRGGKVNIQYHDIEDNAFKSVEGALVRVRGVSSPDRDKNQMLLPRLRLFNTTFTVDELPPAQPFALPLKHAYDLRLFDARADALRRVRISGLVLGEQHGEFFVMDGTNGFHFRPQKSADLRPGDQVEVVGFPDMNGASPVLREALAQTIGQADLPEPRQLAGNAMLNGLFDSTLVSVTSRLLNISADRNEQILELQTGNRSFVARLEKRNGVLPDILPGSLLGLTGVYVGQGGDRSANREIDSFELLLNSPASIRVLARPSWWTMRHALTVMGALLLGLLAAMVWITLLRRQVEERSQQLTSEIKSRERAERQHALEEERTRIARDLHDDLGATLTEIRFLSAVKSHDSLVPENTRYQLSEVSEKSRQLVSSLDEIVWAVNPANDSLPSLASYLRHVAEEFFRNTSVRCRLDVEETLPEVPLTSEVRHNLYLVIREALNNIAKHAQASEVWLRIRWAEHTLSIVLEDNGCGFANAAVLAPGDGLLNMRKRLEKIGGRFECESQLGSGTACRIWLPIS